MSFEVIRNKLKSVLESIDSIQEVADYPTETFNGFPAVIVDSARMESEFQTTNENKRTYIFTLWVLEELENKGIKQARRTIEGVCDDIIQTLDEDQGLDGIQNDLPTRETMIIAFPAVPTIIDNEKYVVAEFEVKVVISFAIS